MGAISQSTKRLWQLLYNYSVKAIRYPLGICTIILHGCFLVDVASADNDKIGGIVLSSTALFYALFGIALIACAWTVREQHYALAKSIEEGELDLPVVSNEHFHRELFVLGLVMLTPSLWCGIGLFF